jgi:hypothetical protein
MGGILVWALSPAVTGRVEPWDADSPYYWASLFIVGFASGLTQPSKPAQSYLLIVTGQSAAVLFGVFFRGRDIGLFFPMGLIMLFAFSLLALGGALIGAKLGK